jgi:hypothetical protein
MTGDNSHTHTTVLDSSVSPDSGNINEPTAALQVLSNRAGFLPARLTAAQRDAITVEATGIVTVVDYTALAGATLTVAGHALVEGAAWTAATSNDATATSLASAVDALAEVTAAPTGASVNITADVAPLSGNDITLVTSDADNLTISGDTLGGGIQPADGLMIYNSDSSEMNYFSAGSSNWQKLSHVDA